MPTESTEKGKQWKNLFTYAVILLLGVMIIIVIAAMADNRERELDNRINETQQTNMSIQEELVALQDENYALQQENEALQAELDSRQLYIDKMGQLTEVWALYTSGNTEAAIQRLQTIKTDDMEVPQLAYYEALCTVLGVDASGTAAADTAADANTTDNEGETNHD